MDEKNVTILLVDDHAIVRSGLAKLLEPEPGLKVIGEATNGRDVLQRAENLRPDIVLMDIVMPQLNGIEATRQLKKILPETKVIILSMYAHERFVSEALEFGASGYLMKHSTTPLDIVQAIKAAMKGDTFLSPGISRKVVDSYLSMKKAQNSQTDLYSSLTNREREVFQMVAEGRSTREIAQKLYVSVSTIKAHRANIMEKLNMTNLSQLIQFAISLGLVENAHLAEL
jgi:two-component system response regulator NreC